MLRLDSSPPFRGLRLYSAESIVPVERREGAGALGLGGRPSLLIRPARGAAETLFIVQAQTSWAWTISVVNDR